MDRGVGGVWPIRGFFSDFFNLTRPLRDVCTQYERNLLWKQKLTNGWRDGRTSEAMPIPTGPTLSGVG